MQPSMTANEMSKPEAGWLIWAWWVLATTISSIISFSLCVIVGFMTMGAGFLAAGILIGFVVGGTQGWVLSRQLRQHFSVPVLREWLIANTIGGCVSFLATIFLVSGSITIYVLLIGPSQPTLIDLTYLIFALMAVIVGFALFGTSQWFVLRKWLTGAIWWIPINALSGCLAIYIAGALTGPMIMQSSSSDAGLPLDFLYAVFLSGTLAATIWAMLTGIGIVWLLRRELSHKKWSATDTSCLV